MSKNEELINYRCPICDGENMQVRIVVEHSSLFFWCTVCDTAELGLQIKPKQIEGLIRHQLGDTKLEGMN